MSSGARMAHADALARANELMQLLANTYARAVVAGSIRREAATVGDIEIVLSVPEGDGDPIAARCEALLTAGKIKKRLRDPGSMFRTPPIAWGPRYKALLYAGCNVDLFIVQPDRQFGPTLLIRTGPGDANKVLVAPRDKGGVLPDGVSFKDGALFLHDALLDTPEEADVLLACGLPFIEPKERSTQKYLSLAGKVTPVWKVRGLQAPRQPSLF